MTTSFTSTKALVEASRNSVLKMQRQLIVAQKEVSTGRYADMGVALGARSTRTVSMRMDISHMTMIIDTNSAASTRLDATQSAITSITENAQAFLSTLLASRTTSVGPGIAENEAKAQLASLTDALNSSFGGEFLFAGIKTDTKPIADYFATPTSAPKTALDQAFADAFGTTQSDPAIKTSITVDGMNDFLNGAFADLFSDTNWADLWSNASDQNVISRISTSEKIQTSSNANITAFRKLAQATTMVADLGVTNLNASTYTAIIDQATQMLSEAVQGLVIEQSRLGSSQERISQANIRLQAQIDVVTSQVNNMEVVDPYDAALRVTSLLTQLEASYSMTARIQNLSILNYI